MNPFNVLCPFHKEKTASCRIWSSGYFFCYGCLEDGYVKDNDFLLGKFNSKLEKILEKNGQLVFDFWV